MSVDSANEAVMATIPTGTIFQPTLFSSPMSLPRLSPASVSMIVASDRIEMLEASSDSVSPTGDHGRERGTAGGRTAEPFDEVVQPPVGHLGQEGQGHVEVLRERPSEWRGLASYVQERVEILDHVDRRNQGREHSHGDIQPCGGFAPYRPNQGIYEVGRRDCAP